MNGWDRLPRERIRHSRMCRSSSRVITFRARGALLPVFAMTCANSQTLMRRRTSRQVFDHCPLSVRPTAAHLAAFILPSCGWSAFATGPHRPWCDVLRSPAMNAHANHCGLRSGDLGTNKLSTADLAVDRGALDVRDDGGSSAVRRSLGPSFGSLAGCCGFDGNNALDQPRSRASEAETDPRKGLGCNVEEFDIDILRQIEVGSVRFRSGCYYRFREFDVRLFP